MNHPDSNFPLVDLTLARRLERTEARGGADFVETRAKVQPESLAVWIEVAGAYAMFDGITSPITQTFGLGMFEAVTPEVLEQLETFFQQREAPVFHEISPLADLSLLTLLHERNYYPIELTSVMYRPLTQGFQLAKPRNENINVRLIRADEHQLWAQTAAQGWSELTELTDLIFELSQMSVAREHALSFIAELDGKAIATGALSLCEGVALLAGASTIPGSRQQGAQLALLESRLQYAASLGCDLAMMCALPGSASQRNAERQGFRIAYTRIKWAKT